MRDRQVSLACNTPPYKIAALLEAHQAGSDVEVVACPSLTPVSDRRGGSRRRPYNSPGGGHCGEAGTEGDGADAAEARAGLPVVCRLAALG